MGGADERPDLSSGHPDCDASRACGPHQLCIEPAHYQPLRAPPRSPAPGRAGGTAGFAVPEVAIREWAVYDALVGQEVGHD